MRHFFMKEPPLDPPVEPDNEFNCSDCNIPMIWTSRKNRFDCFKCGDSIVMDDLYYYEGEEGLAYDY